MINGVFWFCFPHTGKLKWRGRPFFCSQQFFYQNPLQKIFLTTRLSKVVGQRAPQPTTTDRIPNVALKTAARMTPHTFVDIYNKCLSEGIFPTRWKLQRLVLLLKPGKQSSEPSSYRPLCMLDTIEKIFERIICDRL